MFDKSVYADVATAVPEIAIWCLANESYFPNCQTGTECAKIRDENDDTDIASVLDNGKPIRSHHRTRNRSIRGHFSNEMVCASKLPLALIRHHS